MCEKAADLDFDDKLKEVESFTNDVIHLTCLCGKQCNKSSSVNNIKQLPSEYYRRTVYIPFMDGIMM